MSYYDELPYNPFIHGTSSQTLSMMQSTDFQLMPVVEMLRNFKVAPMVGELTQGGFDTIGNGSEKDAFIGASSFGRMQHDQYNLNKVIKDYTQYSDNTNVETCKEKFKNILKRAPQTAFSNLNLLMIYLVRLRQLGVKISEVVPIEEINILKDQLQASIQFYYFILCIQKYIFIDGAEMERFRKENNLTNFFAMEDYIEHFFSFENFQEKLIQEQCNVEEIYNTPSPANIQKLLNFIKISKDTQQNVKRYPGGEDNFIPQKDYNFFTAQKQEPGCKVGYQEIGGYLFGNLSKYSFSNYLNEHYKTCENVKENGDKSRATFPNFATFHTRVLPYIDVLKDRVQLCNTLLDAQDNEFVPHNERDELIIKPFPIVFVTETKTIKAYENEYRSCSPLKLGREIRLVATDNADNQKRLRNYIQNNNLGPVEVLLLDNLYTIGSQPLKNCFDGFANDDVVKAFELARQQNCMSQFSQLYRALSELNEKRFRFKSTNNDMHEKLNSLFTDLQQNVLTPDKDKINFKGIQDILRLNREENATLYATHRGILGIIDTLLTILVSLVIFYPITYLIQKSTNVTHTFFATDTERKFNHVETAAEEMANVASHENQF